MADQPRSGAADPPGTNPDAPPEDGEQTHAEALRAALDDPRIPNEDADLARALASAFSPRDLPARVHQDLISRALERGGARLRATRRVRLAFGAGAVLALAAGVCAVVWASRRGNDEIAQAPSLAPSADQVAPILSRSTQALFATRFPTIGGETARIDRIALVRSAEFRDGEFAKWGVR